MAKFLCLLFFLTHSVLTRHVMYTACNVILRHFRADVVAVAKQSVLCILSVCLYSKLSSKQSACAILSFMAYAVLPYLFTLSHKKHDFREKKYY